MKRSTDRILTTHAGRLNGPPELSEAAQKLQRGQSDDYEAILPLVRNSMIGVLKQQTDAGIDIVSDGELGKIGFGLSYYGKRLTGLGSRPVQPGEAAIMSGNTGERIEFAEFYDQLRTGGGAVGVPQTSASFATARSSSSARTWSRPTSTSSSPPSTHPASSLRTPSCACWRRAGWSTSSTTSTTRTTGPTSSLSPTRCNVEYKAIVDAGFILQLDDPGLPDTYDMIVPNPSIEEYRKFAQIRVDAMNRALEGIPEDRVRYHICWGSWHGPHTHDLPLKHVVDLMLQVKAQAYSVEAANPRHEHEWKVWRDVKLPAGKILIPGVVSHASNVVEHPELVADRIIQYAELVGKENVIAGTDCGMGNRVHPQIGWAKLKALSEGAAMASKQLWG